MAEEIILNDSESGTLEYIEITNSGVGTFDGANDMLIVEEHNPSVPVYRPPYIAEDIANK